MKIDGINIKGITSDSRKIKEGYAFVAIEGYKFDGNNFIKQAIKKGAAIVYTEKNISSEKVKIIKVINARKKLAELLNIFYDYPSEKLHLIGVTGTNGKTTTSHIVDEIFSYSGFKTGLIGTMGIKYKDVYKESKLTTPDPETLFKTLNDFVNNGIEFVTMEVSSHALNFFRTYGLEFDVAIHTNIEKDHINLHKTFEKYVETKKTLFDSLNRNKLAIINIDDKNGIELIKNNDKALVITYGLNKKASITASTLQSNNNISFNLCIQRGITTYNGIEIEPFEFKLYLNLLGKHNIYNTLAAVSAALYFGIDIDIIRKSLEGFTGISRRLEKIYDNDFLVIDDFCHNPSSYAAVLETIQSLKYNKIIMVNSIRGNRGIEINEDNVKEICSWIPMLGETKVILSLSEDTVTNKDTVSKEELKIYEKILTEKKIQYKVFNTLTNSIKEALKQVNKDDIILLLGAQGMNDGRIILKEFLKELTFLGK
ncbi:MAG: UDP-N-acetylmuramoyl-L-alanyl-D-glutamate--2,6-diaminopimelate ligase [Firmicutes bacterium]|nr:UDP-N-acetylmuramoyl-L-alanyl-D-glutamate--2,6-diaminopimelate ligase [Bacillota bacterium]